MRTQRQLVDYALRRRAQLADVHAGRTSALDACDAHPYLLQAARYHGQPSTVTCPVCRKERLDTVSWVYGDLLGQASGSARKPAELERLATLVEEFTVYVVEVCRSCHWNHLVQSYVLGYGGTAEGRSRKPGTRKTAGQ